jgi:hypothetical protein
MLLDIVSSKVRFAVLASVSPLTVSPLAGLGLCVGSLEMAILGSRLSIGSSSTRAQGYLMKSRATRAFLELPALSSGWCWIRRV